MEKTALFLADKTFLLIEKSLLIFIPPFEVFSFILLIHEGSHMEVYQEF